MLRRLYVHNFRCLENFELPINGNRNLLLIGKNGSGKTTIGLALEVLQKIGRGVSYVDELVKPRDLTSWLTADVPMRFEIEAEIAGRVLTYVISFELPDSFKALRIREEKFQVDGNDVFNRNFAEVMLSKRGRSSASTFSMDWHRAALPIIQEQSNNDPIADFKRWLAGALILTPIPSLINGGSTGETLQVARTVTNFGDWFSGVVGQSPAAYIQIDRYLKQIMPDLREIENLPTGKDTRSLSIKFAIGDATITVPFEDLSDGEKCFIISALVVVANDADNPLLCYWDEPDSYLAPDEIGHIVTALRKAYGRHGQFITSSHSPEALRRFADENTVVLYRRSHLEPTTPRILEDLQIKGDLIDTFIRGDVEP